MTDGQNSSSRGQLFPRGAKSKVASYNEDAPRATPLGDGTQLRHLDGEGTQVGIRMSTIPRAGNGLFANKDFEYNPSRTKQVEICQYGGTILTYDETVASTSSYI